MSPRRPRGTNLSGAPASIALALATLALTSCSSAPPSSPALHRDIGPVRSGTISYHAPPARRGSFQGRTTRQAVPLVITTESRSAEVKAEESGVIVSRGTISRDAARGSATETEVLREISRGMLQRQRGKFVSPETFATVWESLVEAGIEALPTIRPDSGRSAPTDLPWISLETGGRRWVFLRPDEAFAVNRARQGLGKEQREAWQRCAVVFATWYSP